MSTPTSDGRRDDDTAPEGEEPERGWSDPTAPIFSEPTTSVPPPPPPYSPAPGQQSYPPPPPQSAAERDDPFAYQPQDTPRPGSAQSAPPSYPAAPQPAQPYVASQPYAQGQPPPPGAPYPAYGAQGPYYAQPQQNTSGLVLTIVSALTVFGTCLVGIPSLVLGIMALTSQNKDIALSRRRSRIGWIVYAVNWGVAILAVVIFVVLAIVASNGANTSGYN